jgi:hypothetical protein
MIFRAAKIILMVFSMEASRFSMMRKMTQI